MRIPIDRQSETPLYRQIEEFFRRNILSGNLPAETRLPATRELARDLELNRITIENAYAELEADGLIYTRPGSGAYVLPPTAPPATTPPGVDIPLPRWQNELQPLTAIIRTDLPIETADPDIINFADGGGDAQRFPADDFRKYIQAVIRRDGIAALEYGDRNGYPPLRHTIAHILASQGLQTHPDNILITGGSQQAISLVVQLLLKPGDVILVENPTYGGALDLFRSHHLQIVGIPMDTQGMQIPALETLLQRYPARLLYTIPNFQNPTGTCLNSQRRRQLLALADRYNLPILEDDFVGDLRYDGRVQPTLKALDPGGRVIYISTFSKMLMPGLRIGFLVAEGPVYSGLAGYKRAHDLATSNLIQRALEAYVTIGRYQAHLRRSCQLYRRRRDTMQQALRYELPQLQYHLPQGGLFIWAKLPPALSATRLLPLAIREGVTFAPGPQFFPEEDSGDACLRLNFAAHSPEKIIVGIQRLKQALQKLS